MSVSRITHTENGRAALQYAIHTKSKRNDRRRVVALSSVNMAKSISFEKQMRKYWNRASDRNKCQMRRCVISFSPNELDVNNEKHWIIADEISREFVQRAFPNRQAVIVTHGDTDNLHCHILVNNIDMITGKGLRGRETTAQYVKNISDEVVKEVFNRYDLKFDTGKKRGASKTQAEIQIDKKKQYSFKDDIRGRILKAKETASSYDQFLEQLSKYGVNISRNGKDLTYVLMDTEEYQKQMGEIPSDKAVRVKGKKLGSDFTKNTIQEYFKSKSVEVAPPIDAQEETKRRNRRFLQHDQLQSVESYEISVTGSDVKEELVDNGEQGLGAHRETIPISDEQQSFQYRNRYNNSMYERESKIFNIGTDISYHDNPCDYEK